MSGDISPPVRRRTWPRVLGFLLLVTVVGGAITWLVWPKTVTATALFEVRNEKSTLTGDLTAHSLDEYDFEVLKKTQVALLKSKFLLTSALRDPGIASLPLFAGVSEPEEWLQDHLDLSYPENGEILAISLSGSELQRNDLALVVNAVAEAYKKEVLGKETSRRLNVRDMLARSLHNLNGEIRRKYEDYLDIAKGMGKSEGGSDIQMQLDMKRLDRIDDELAQLERELLRNNSGNYNKDSKFIAARLEQLQKRQSALEKNVIRRNEMSVELETRREELKQLQQIAGGLNISLEKLDIDNQLPATIQHVQQAVVTDGKKIARQQPTATMTSPLGVP